MLIKIENGNIKPKDSIFWDDYDIVFWGIFYKYTNTNKNINIEIFWGGKYYFSQISLVNISILA